jgi:signal transduction histidine kinase
VLELEVSDNGTTVGDPSSDSPAGHGLAGMRERAAMFGGDVLAGPGPGGGWRVALRLDIGGEPPAVVDS